MRKQVVLLLFLAAFQIICCTLAYIILITPAWIHKEHKGVDYDYGIFEGCITSSSTQEIYGEKYTCSFCRTTTDIKFHQGVDHKDLQIAKTLSVISMVSKGILFIALMVCLFLALCRKTFGTKIVFIVVAIFGIIQIASYVTAVVFTMLFFGDVDHFTSREGEDVKFKLTDTGYGMILAWINCVVELVIFILLNAVGIHMIRETTSPYY